MTNKEIILFRHAKKNFDSADPELSAEGIKQAESLVQIVQQNKLPHPQKLISSPKRRAQQTFIHLHEALQIPLVVESALDECGPKETRQDFKQRINHFLFKDLPRKSSSCLFLCTHLDWIEVFAELSDLDINVTSELLLLPPAAFYHLSFNSEGPQEWSLIQKGQIF